MVKNGEPRDLDAEVGALRTQVALLQAELRTLSVEVAKMREVVFPAEYDRWVPLRRAAELTGIPHRTLNLYAANDRCPAHKFRGLWYIDPRWVAAQAAQRRAASTERVE